jgi:hypothetical protein
VLWQADVPLICPVRVTQLPSGAVNPSAAQARGRFARLLPALKLLHGLNGSHACAALVAA